MSNTPGKNWKVTSVGRRDTSGQSNMVQGMKEEYCPDAAEGTLWDPVTGHWELAHHLHAASLYPWRQVESMDSIFGPGANADVFSPNNGLFLDEWVEKALDQGLIAFVPNVDLEANDKDLPPADIAERNQRLRDWETAPKKEYRVAVLDFDNKLVHISRWRDGSDFKTLADLDGRPLKFHTNFRPRARYVWWTFMNAILQTAWRQKQNEKNVLRQEVANAIRYWGTCGRHVKKNMLRGFVDELGQDIDSILENYIEEDDTGDTGDADPGAVAVMACETVFRTQEAAKKDEDESEDEHEDGNNGRRRGWKCLVLLFILTCCSSNYLFSLSVSRRKLLVFSCIVAQPTIFFSYIAAQAAIPLLYAGASCYVD
ncbi:uncharacterized protein BP5553_00102 [Venustampulla echinocandica]|uniref:HNH nuclease domain-containing protein n=1 Tax=Venustampulla echinocandica TaxID=2656787 RepID=A0A370TX75_9HELO|nr:uncharacterized protein BP5553_00102 [Venustampulla echinocandica]RDL40123.1 hypothetical protein BP5553_00102 [Venustampulla echinocandica]